MSGLKFLCDNCKAKYQIADEKVAGKTVRMTCRKCGHSIEVRAAVTETSVAAAPPRASTPPRAPTPPLATSLSAAKPRPPQPPRAPQPPQAPRASQVPPARKLSQPPPGALAGAFQRTVQTPSARPPAPPPPPREVRVTEEWYVAIQGVPVGPIQISELRRKAASGAVTEESLCWQEGMEEWRPVRTVPELAEIVREAALGGRPSLVSPEPPAARPTPPPPPPRTSSGPQRPSAPAPLRTSDPPRPIAPPPAARSNVVPLHGRTAATTERVSEPIPIPAPIAGNAAAARAPFLQPQPTPHPAAPGFQPLPSPLLAPTPTPMAVADPFGLPTATPSLFPPAPIAYAQPGPPRRSPPLWFWLVLVFVLGFGGVAAFFVFQKPAPAPVVIQVPTPAPTPTVSAAPPPTEGEAPAEETTTNEGPSPSRPRVASKGAPAPPTTSTGRAADLKGLLGDPGGPSVGGSHGSTGPATGGGLDQAAVQRVVRERQPAVKRACWERGADQKSSAKVSVEITVAPNGSVQNARATGDDPVIAKCIENQVRNWSFPAPGSTTTVNVPFVFVRQ